MLETSRKLQTHVYKVLQISFDSLPSENCRELFKHIACFFVGKDREATETILKECGIRTSYGITKLIDRCLLTIGARKNELRMHQLLQEMGRGLVCKESSEKPWKRSRVWNHGESLNLLKEDKGTPKIQGLVLDMIMLEKEPLHGLSVAGHGLEDDDPNMIFGIGPYHHSVLKLPSYHCNKNIELRTNALRKMDKLNLLQLNHVNLKGSYKNFPEGIRGLCMHGFQLKYIPSDLPMENLVALDMSYSNLTQLWKKPKLLGALKILNLSYCKQLVRVGGFSGLPALERLILVGCERLIEVCESIGGCDGLVFLDMSYCKELQKLPSSIGKLKKLKVLSINGCIGAFPSELKVLKADDISIKPHNSFYSLTNYIPASPKTLLLSLAPSVIKLSLGYNNLRTESFPTDFSSLSKLEELNLNGNPIESLPDCVSSLSRLKSLHLRDCSKLTSLCCSISTLRHLHVSHCLSLVKVTFPQVKPIARYCDYLASDSVTEVEGEIKIQALAQVDEEILCSLGWTKLQDVKYLDLTIWNSRSWISAKKLPIQMYFEFGIFNTCFPGEEVPIWFRDRSTGSSLSFIIPSSPINKSIQGLNIGFVHMFSGRGRVSVLGIKVRNMTKDRSWTYYGCISAIQKDNGGLVWLSHWMFASNELEAGDEVSIDIIDDEEEDEEQDGVIVTECAISPVYIDTNKEEYPLGYYKSWKLMVGEFVPRSQFTEGNYLITHRIKYLGPYKGNGLFWRGIRPTHRATHTFLY